MNERKSLIVPAFGAAALGLAAYGVGIEPYKIRWERIALHLPRLPLAFDGFTICQLSDLHQSRMGRREQIIRRLLDALPDAPDMVALTGDMVHTSHGIAPFLELARSLRAKEGVFFIYGNSEYKNGVQPHALSKELAAAGMVSLNNAHRVLERNGERLALAGVDDSVNDRDRLSQALDGLPDGLPTLLLMHSPDGIAGAVAREVDLVLSGHTHGGQVRLPLLGALHTHVRLGRRMSSGYYAGKKLRKLIGIRPEHTQLYVSRGAGISGLSVRFLTPPEIAWITLHRGPMRFESTRCDAISS